MVQDNSFKLLLCLVFCLTAQLLSGQDIERVKGVIDTLSSPKFHGRGYVAEGDRRAAAFISQKFEEIRLKKFSKSYYQYFALNVNTFPGIVRLKVNKQKLIPGQDFLVNSISKTGKGSGKVIRLDTMIFSSKEAQNTFLDTKLKSKILVYAHRDFGRIIDLPKAVIDKMYEAKALIELKDTKLVGTLSNRQLSNPIFELDRQLLDSLYQSEKKNTAKFRVDAVMLDHYISQNVIGYVEGTSRPDSFLVVTAHYDHLGRMGRKVYFPGANDNASGVSLLLELARHYAKNPLKYSIVFMAFGGEEIGLFGSKYFVENPLFPLKNIRFLFNVDLVGTGDDGATVVNGSVFEKEFERLKVLNEKHRYLPKITRRGLAANSDHYFFTERGVPSFFLYTLGGIKAYHDIYDKAETLPLTRFSEVYQLIKNFLDGF